MDDALLGARVHDAADVGRIVRACQLHLGCQRGLVRGKVHVEAGGDQAVMDGMQALR